MFPVDLETQEIDVELLCFGRIGLVPRKLLTPFNMEATRRKTSGLVQGDLPFLPDALPDQAGINVLLPTSYRAFAKYWQ